MVIVSAIFLLIILILSKLESMLASPWKMYLLLKKQLIEKFVYIILKLNVETLDKIATIIDAWRLEIYESLKFYSFFKNFISNYK